MKYFKHMTDAHSGLFFEEVMDNFGLEGIGAYWIIMEIYGRACKDEPGSWVEISHTVLRRKLRKSSTKVQQLLNFYSTSGALLFNFSREKLNICVPKMQELRDEWTRKLRSNSGASPELVPPYIKSKSNNKPPKSPTGESAFEKFWCKYPKKAARKLAQSIWRRQKLDARIDEILSGLEVHITSEQWQKGYVPNPTTFLNQERWLDEVHTQVQISHSSGANEEFVL